MTEPSTPLMRQYAAVKKEHPTALLFFRLGDFYELFFDDALVAAKELQITLTSRNKEKGIAVPMCGVPYHAADGYIGKLIRRGFKVAICEQMEDPKVAKKLVRREVTSLRRGRLPIRRSVRKKTTFWQRWRRWAIGLDSRPWIFRQASSGPPSSPARAHCDACRKNWSSFGPRNCCMARRHPCSNRLQSSRALLGRTAEGGCPHTVLLQA